MQRKIWTLMTYHVKKYFTHFKSIALTLHDLHYVQPHNIGNDLYVNIIFVCAKKVYWCFKGQSFDY